MKKTILFTSLVVSAMAAHGQSAGPASLTAAGGSATIGGNTYEYAIGQVENGTTLTAGSLVVMPGVLQPISKTTDVAHGPAVITNLEVYPSPVSGTLYIQPHFGQAGSMQYGIYDAAGRLVLQQEAVLKTGAERQETPTRSLAAGQYTLRVQWFQNNQMMQGVYKIQKLQ